MTFGELPGTADETVRKIIRPIDESRGWMKLLAVVMIVQGVFLAITIIGLLIAWLPIWLGVLLWQSADAARKAREAGDEAIAVDSLTKLKTMITIYGVVALIGVAFWGLMIIFIVVAAISGSFNSS